MFCREGAAVTLVARKEGPTGLTGRRVDGSGGRAQYVAGDVARRADADRAVAAAVSAYRGLDAAFSNAGVAALPGPMHLMEDAVFDEVMEVNVRGVWNCMRAELTAMLERGARRHRQQQQHRWAGRHRGRIAITWRPSTR